MSVTTADAPMPAAPAAGQRKSAFRHYRHLTLELAISQFKLKYTGSALGYLWSLVKPAMLFATMYFIFVGLFKIKDNTPYFAIQLLVGIVIWTFFAECTALAMQTVAGTGHLIRKAYFPRSILVISASLTSMFTFSINLVLVYLVAVVTGQFEFGLRLLVMIPLLIELYLLVLGISLFLSALFVQFRDVGHLWEVSSQVLFYGSAVVYSLTFINQLHRSWVLDVVAANPVAQIIEDARHAMITAKAPWTSLMVPRWLIPVPYLIVVIVLAAGALTFHRRAPRFAENI